MTNKRNEKSNNIRPRLKGGPEHRHYQTEAQTLHEAQTLALDKQRQTYTGEIKGLETTIAELNNAAVQLDAKLQHYANQLGDAKNGTGKNRHPGGSEQQPTN